MWRIQCDEATATCYISYTGSRANFRGLHVNSAQRLSLTPIRIRYMTIEIINIHYPSSIAPPALFLAIFGLRVQLHSNHKNLCMIPALNAQLINIPPCGNRDLHHCASAINVLSAVAFHFHGYCAYTYRARSCCVDHASYAPM